MNISSIDLNLLRTFVVLMEERSVSAAARRLHLSQPATSNALERLRDALGDRVLDREGRTMVPTRKALDLWPQVDRALQAIDQALGSVDDPNPSLMETTFTLGVDEYSVSLLGTRIVDQVALSAPNVQLAFLPTDASLYAEQLSSARVDLVVGPHWRQEPDLVQRRLYNEEFVGLMADTHPHYNRRMTLRRYVTCPHVLVSSRGIVEGNVDVALRREGLTRRIALATPWFDGAPDYLSGSDRLLNMGRRLADRLVERYPIVPFELPLRVSGFSVSMLWHPRSTSDASHRWLREIVSESVERDFASPA